MLLELPFHTFRVINKEGFLIYFLYGGEGKIIEKICLFFDKFSEYLFFDFKYVMVKRNQIELLL
mgnify:CR=1 FL=1